MPAPGQHRSFDVVALPVATVVGRTREVALLRALLAKAATGHTQILAITGESGIGKTHLAHFEAESASDLGFRCIWIPTHENQWQPAYHPWLQTIRQVCADQCLPAAAAQVPPWVPALLPLLPVLQDRFPQVASLGDLPLAEGRYRIAEAIAAAVRDACRDQPLLMVIDDLQWCDDESLRVFQHVVETVYDVPLMLMVTVRDDDPGAHQLLPQTLASLRRRVDAVEMVLGGFSASETASLIGVDSGDGPWSELVGQVQALTGGNPFHIHEVKRHLLNSGMLDAERAAGEGVTPITLTVPANLKQIVSLRLQPLTQSTRHMLHKISVCAGGFDFQIASALSELDDDALLDSIDEALQARLIVSSAQAGEWYDFAHELVRRALYETWSPSRRIRLHRALAESLSAAARAGNMKHHAPVVARHYHISAQLPGVEDGVPFALAAAQAARERFAPEQAATYLRMARDMAVLLPAGERAAIACELSLAEIEALWLDDALASAHEALRMMDQADSSPSQRAGYLADVVTGLHDGGQAPALWSPLLYAGLSAVPDDDPVTWARLTLLVERFEPVTYGAMHGARWLGSDPRAVEIAWESGNESLIARSLQPWDLWERERTDELAALVATWQTPPAVIRGLTVCGADWLYHHGDFRRAQAHFTHLLRFAEHQVSVPGMAEACVRLGIIHTALGNREQARAFESLAKAHVRRLGEGHRLKASLWWVQALATEYWAAPDGTLADCFAAYLSDPSTARRTIAFDDAALTAFLLARAGHGERAQLLLDQVIDVLPRLEPRLWLLNGTVAFAGAAAWILGDRSAAGPIRDCAIAVREAGHGDFPGGSIWLTIARMAWLNGDAEGSAAAFAQARTDLEASGQRPLRAIVDHDEAVSLAGGTFGMRVRSHELATLAHQQFTALAMTAWQGRADELLATLSEHGSVDAAVPGGLTPREIDVVRLLAQGHSDSQIARDIFVSTRTVNTHVRNILAKTGMRNRAALTRWTIDQGLVITSPAPLRRGT